MRQITLSPSREKTEGELRSLPTTAYRGRARFTTESTKNTEIAEMLVARGVPVDRQPPGERTLPHAFSHQGNHRTVAWLLAHGANVHARGPGGRTALHFAAERNTGPKTLSLLVEHGAELSIRDDDGHTPLDIAQLNAKPRLVEWIAGRIHAKRR